VRCKHRIDERELRADDLAVRRRRNTLVLDHAIVISAAWDVAEGEPSASGVVRACRS
jgi:hypothetical protein